MQNNRRPSVYRPSAVKYVAWRAARPLPLDKFKHTKRSGSKPGIRMHNVAISYGKFNILMSRLVRILPIWKLINMCLSILIFCITKNLWFSIGNATRENIGVHTMGQRIKF